MIPLIPALALAFLSFIASAFVILRIILPILPPHPLSKRVSPAEFGLPSFRSLSAANKSHVWLAALDLLSLAVFVWQAIDDATRGSLNLTAANDPAYSVRLCIILTLRQTCFLVLASVALLHVRHGRPMSFGKKHWMLWAPMMLLVVTSTAFAGVLSGAGIDSLFFGLTAYTSTIALLSTIALGCLIRTLYNIKQNLAAIEEEADPWPPVKQVEEKQRPSFTTEEIDAIRDGASWITSNAGSRRNSVSTWSFSTHHTAVGSQHGHSRSHGSHASLSAIKSSNWFGSPSPVDDAIPPVPPLPSPYSSASDDLNDPDPFRRDVPTQYANPRERLGSQTSWLTSTSGSHATMSGWSFPTTHKNSSIHNISTSDLHTPLTATSSRPVTPALADAQVLGGYGYAPGSTQAEKGLVALAAPSSAMINVSGWHVFSWLLTIWVPFGLGLPYLVLSQHGITDANISVLLILSVTLSSPMLALNLIRNSPIPIPVGLFESHDTLPADIVRGPSRAESHLPYKFSYEYKRSMSTSATVVEGRRSGDVWLINGDAVDGKNKMGRAVGMLGPMPKLSVLPSEEIDDMPPVPIRIEDASLIGASHNRSHSETSAQFGRVRKDSKTSSHLSGGDESLAFAAQVMIAQRHYSALAQTVVVPSTSPGKQETAEPNQLLSATTAIAIGKPSSHLRTRSISSFSGPESPSIGGSLNISGPPPSDPLPPTPPNVRAARLAQLKHKKSFSSGFSFGPVDDVNEIDALTAGVLPLLIPGLKVGSNMKIKDEKPGTLSKNKSRTIAQRLREFGGEFSSPEFHSTPARHIRDPRGRKQSAHKRNHQSLPSLGLGKGGVHSLATWSAEIKEALETKVVQYAAIPSNVEVGQRNTVFGGDSMPNYIPVAHLHALREEEELNNGAVASLGRTLSTRSLGLRADVPHAVNEARFSSLTLDTMMPPASAASTVTLFEDFEAGLDSGPLAESTPHNTVGQKPKFKYVPPPLPLDEKSNRRSSIIYIKSTDDNHNVLTETNSSTPPERVTSNTSAISSLAQWSTRAVRPLIPKASKLQRNGSGTKSPGRGLRPLSLLQNRDVNAVPTSTDNSAGVKSNVGTMPKLRETRPLSLGKKQKSRAGMKPPSENLQDENAPPSRETSLKSKGLKPLKLSRSETAKMRGILRKNEVLPEVIVRPPSTVTENTAFAYNYD
ncbi:hypothetical protein AX17_001362 [Amanita inopinata Kibby_2008]|nr:hypothetical protein AX17_001362 [Amanita inopinata Kibby_2008]